MKPLKREKQYTDYSYVTHHELKRILNLSAEGVDFLLTAGHVLSSVIGKRKKFILGHVRKAQEDLVQKQNERTIELLRQVKTGSKSKYRKVN